MAQVARRRRCPALTAAVLWQGPVAVWLLAVARLVVTTVLMMMVVVVMMVVMTTATRRLPLP